MVDIYTILRAGLPGNYLNSKGTARPVQGTTKPPVQWVPVPNLLKQLALETDQNSFSFLRGFCFKCFVLSHAIIVY